MTTSPDDRRRRVTAADIARSLGISRATVGFVINDTPGQTISAHMRQRVLDEAARLGYRPHTAARALASGRSNIVLLVLPEWPLDYSMRAHLDEASLVLDQVGYSLVTMTPHPGGQARPLWETLSPDVVMTLAPIPESDVEAIVRTGAKTVIAGRDSVAEFDQAAYADGPRLQTEHLHALGRHRLAFAAPTDARLSDLVQQRSTLAESTASTLDGVSLTIEHLDEQSAAVVVADWAERGVDGVISYNDDVAALILREFLRLKVAVPETVAIVGHDDSPIARLLVPSLSSVRVDSAGLGRFLAQLALRAVGAVEASSIDAPVPTVELVRRESS